MRLQTFPRSTLFSTPKIADVMTIFPLQILRHREDENNAVFFVYEKGILHANMMPLCKNYSQIKNLQGFGTFFELKCNDRLTVNYLTT